MRRGLRLAVLAAITVGSVLLVLSPESRATTPCSAPPCPAITSASVSPAGGSTATVSATIFTYGSDTTWTVDLGTTDAYELGSTPGPPLTGDSGGGTATSLTLTGLTPGTLYHYRVVATNGFGTTTGDDATFRFDPCSVSASCPAILNVATSGIGVDTARIDASIFARGQQTQWEVQYGPDTGYGTTLSGGVIPAGAQDPQPVALVLNGLQPRTEYHFRLVATNSTGTTTSPDGTFTTADPCALSLCPAIGDVAVATTPTSAAVTGHVFTRNQTTHVRVDYGTSTAYGSSASGADLPPSSSGSTGFAVDLTGLQPRTTYHYRLVATNDSGTTTGDDGTFTTDDPCALGQCPGIVDATATPVGLDTIRVDTHLATRGFDTQWVVEWGADTTYGHQSPAQTVSGDPTGISAVSASVAGLPARTPVHWRVVATNANGTTVGDDATVTIDPCAIGLCPELLLSGTRDVDWAHATVTARIATKSLPTQWSVEYGPTTDYGATAAGADVPGDTAPSDVALQLADLAPDTTYHFRVHVSSAAGDVVGPDETFTTLVAPNPCDIGQCPDGSFAAVSLHARSAVLSGEIFTYGSPTQWTLEWGAGGAYDHTVTGSLPGDPTGADTVTVNLTGLDPTTTYQFRARAVNGVGPADLGGGSFTTTNGFANVTSLSWARGPDLPKPWFAFTGTVFDGRIYAAGNDPLGRTYSLDPFASEDEWLLEPSTQPYYTQEEGSAVADGKIWMVGSGHPIGEPSLHDVVTQVWDPVTHTWSLGAPLPDQRARFGAAVVEGGGTIYLFGGRTVPGPGSADIYTDAWKLSADRTTWTQVAPPLHPVSDAAIAMGRDGLIYLIGGVDCGGPGPLPGTCARGAIVDFVQVYDPSTNTWRMGAPLPSPRYGAAADTVGGGIVVVGGLDQLPTLLPSGVNVYPPALRRVDVLEYRGDRWLTDYLEPPTIVPHEEHAVVTVNGELWVVGGRSAQPLFETEYLTVKVLASAVPTPAAPDGDNGWYRTPPSIRVNASNGLGGPAELLYGFGGAVSHPYDGNPVFVTAPEGTSTLSYGAVDHVGNASPVWTLDPMKVDSVPPTVTLAAAAGAMTATASDATSGVARVVFYAVDAAGTRTLVATDAAAPYSIPLSSLPPGTASVVAVAFDVAGNHAEASALPLPPATLKLVAPPGGHYGDPALLGVVLKDAAGKPIVGATVTIALGTQSCTAHTVLLGAGACAITPTQHPGPYPLRATFAGDAANGAASADGTFTVTREETDLRLAGPFGGTTAGSTVSATLSEDGLPIAGKTVAFAAGGVTRTATTDARGVATASFQLPAGAYALSASFAGDEDYEPSSASAQLYVGAPCQFVIWGGNRGGVALGGRYTFWSAQWDKQVTAGDYASNASFKGYADSVAGSTWTTRPGNSSKPPQSIDSYVAVIVATHIAKSGSTISGNVAQVVVLRVDAPSSYRPAPGASTTGVAVATVP